jgi:hypothetical protein
MEMSFTSRPLYLWGRNARYALDESLGGVDLDSVEKGKSPASSGNLIPIPQMSSL